MKNTNHFVDSCGWIEYLMAAENKDFFAPYIENNTNTFISSIVIYEVSRILLRFLNENKVLEIILFMKQFNQIEITPEISFIAAKISQEENLAMADSILLASAKQKQCRFITQDIDFKGKNDVEYIKKIQT
jgi:predicted nucleic acid-binding protein